MAEPVVSSYDQVPYTSYPYHRAHPDRLATCGRLFGMRPAPPTACRVLELGCASGGHLLPMADALPGCEFVGIDLSRRQVEQGQAAIVAAGLTNVTLTHGDLDRVDAEWGEFDYIVCHGVYSWVPPATRARILEIMATNLAAQGIGYLSYNTYPGWHLRESVRHMMRFHVAAIDEPGRRTEQARALVEFLAEAVAGRDDPWSALMRRELATLSGASADYLFHEHLEDDNVPVYFHELVERLRERGLQYLGEADVATMLPKDLAPGVADTLARVCPDIVRMEQYMDFVRGRQFRTTLLCRGDVELRRRIGPDSLEGLWVVGLCTPKEEVVPEGGSETFAGPGSITLHASDPATRWALRRLAQVHPDAVPFSDLCAGAGAWLRERAGTSSPSAVRTQLGSDLLEAFFRGGVELVAMRPEFTTTPSDRPRVGSYARWQAEHLGFVTSRRHRRVDLDEASRRVVALLDGTRDRAQLVEVLTGRIAAGELTLRRDDEVLSAEDARPALEAVVGTALATLARAAVLVA